jgi:hypothetical protein
MVKPVTKSKLRIADGLILIQLIIKSNAELVMVPIQVMTISIAPVMMSQMNACMEDMPEMEQLL